MNMRKTTGIALVVALILCSVGISRPAAAEFDGTLRIGGSTTLLPVVADATSQFMEKYGTWDKADASLPKKQTLIFVTGGGSGFGVNAAIGGTVDIGMSSRDLKDEEKTKLGDHKTVLVSKDCIAFAVNRKSPFAKLDNLTKADVIKIFSGEAKTFKDVRPDLPAKPIVVLMRDMAGGSTEMLQGMVLKEKSFSPSALQVPSQGVNMKKVEENTSAITYISSVIALQNPKLKVLKYEGIAPTNENVVAGTYALTRPLLLLVKGAPSPASQRFIDYMLSEGQSVVLEHGYVPVKKMQ